MKRILFTYFLFSFAFAQAQGDLFGLVKNDSDAPLPFVKVYIMAEGSNEVLNILTDEFGRFTTQLIPGKYDIKATCLFHETAQVSKSIIDGDNKVELYLKDTATLKTINVYANNGYDRQHLGTVVNGVTTTTGKKTQLIDVKKIDANTAVDNPRELYAKVPGLNIWESDGGGLQLGIGARGLSPSRTEHFNTRQNGYDISADALGYPETYYTPPSEALESIQLIRGAASLQFGPQFGGIINFKIKNPSKKAFEYQGAQTYGAYNLINTFNLVSGTIKKRFTYLAYAQHKQGNGWRDNSGFSQQHAFVQLGYHLSDNAYISLEQTYMTYLAQQAGGLTDALFAQNPRQSIRDRNWFKVNWRITALNFNWDLNRTTTLNIKSFKVKADRLALGNLEKISRLDDGKERQLIVGNFDNFGAELRLLKRYPIGKKMLGITAAGARYYQGTSLSRQGLGTNQSDANFSFLNPDNLEGSDFEFPSQNIAAFVENTLRINEKLALSAGLRYEFINTSAVGSFREQVFHPLTNALIFDTTFFEDKGSQRNIFLAGVGFSYKKEKNTEVYGNIAQNYRGINFSDIRIVNPNQAVDPEIQDEKGFNADLGIRGQRKNSVFDFSGFFLYYDNRIGVINEKINEFEFVRLRTNIGRAYSTGIELFAEQKFAKSDSSKHFFTAFANFSAVYSKYGNQGESAISGNWVELVPPISSKVGIKFTHGKWTEGILTTYVHRHFSDATNAISDPNAIAGVIPSYYVIDFNTTFQLNKNVSFKGGVNNLTNNSYFTRRATAYPGPGIIPSDGIGFYLTLGIKL